MSIQPTSIILGSRLGVPPEESAVASLLQTRPKVLDVLRRRWPLLVVPMLTVMLVTLVGRADLSASVLRDATFERRNNLVISKLIASNSPYSFASLRQSLAADFRQFRRGRRGGRGGGSAGRSSARRLRRADLPGQGRMRDDIVGQWVDSISVLIRERATSPTSSRCDTWARSPSWPLRS